MGIVSEIISGVISPITNVFGAYLNKRQDVDLEKFKVDGVIDVEAVRAHIAALTLRRDLLLEAMKYRGIRFFQYAFMTPLALWFNAVVFHCLVGPYWPENKVVWALPGRGDEILMIVIVFLFAGSKIDEWRRKT